MQNQLTLRKPGSAIRLHRGHVWTLVWAALVELFAVYLGGTALAAASPTPGNIGAVEVTLSAGLIAIGVPSAAAVAAVLIYRLLSFWLPLVPGFVAFRHLQAKHHI